MSGHPPFRKKRSYVPAVIVVLTVLFFSFVFPSGLFPGRPLLISFFYPFQLAAGVLLKIPSSVLSLANLSQENGRLKAELDSSRVKLSTLSELMLENQRLRAALSFQAGGGYGSWLLPARVIGRSPSSWLSMLEIDKGETSNVRLNMPVVVRDGLVGRVIEVSNFNAKVLLVTDEDSRVAAVDQRSRDLGMAEGYLPEALRMKYVGAGGEVKEGDKIVTSSISGIFPPGIPIGAVSRAAKKEHDLFYEIEIKPSVNFSRLEGVFLLY
ncbi:rod shape-determining protein MreC [Candidatus Saganbacteria bacterium]|uniref:Cell shape-determining protein MreC n=1 Tax=Candidatus Saganbacteria bacterium TaxID=2575572 RepID=A0A9D6UJR1_UNCSA|nr:rod shape-determining protein MreC [Candidatus Saganbacteria bacterium]